MGDVSTVKGSPVVRPPLGGGSDNSISAPGRVGSPVFDGPKGVAEKAPDSKPLNLKPSRKPERIRPTGSPVIRGSILIAPSAQDFILTRSGEPKKPKVAGPDGQDVNPEKVLTPPSTPGNGYDTPLAWDVDGGRPSDSPTWDTQGASDPSFFSALIFGLGFLAYVVSLPHQLGLKLALTIAANSKTLMEQNHGRSTNMI